MVTDISAVAYDWLMTAKPLVITRPSEPDAVMPDEGFIPEMPLLASHDAVDTSHILGALLSGEDQKRWWLSSWADYYYGGRIPGSSLPRFVYAVESVIEERDRITKSSEVGTSATRATSPDADRAAQGCMSLRSSAAHGLTFVRPSFNFATTGIANMTARSRAESQIVDMPDSAMTKRHAEVLGSIIDWLAALERLNRTHPLSLLAGNPRSYERLREITSLRIHIGRSALATEEIFAALDPALHLQFEQANLYLRELTHRRVLHAYIGTDGDDSWINNRLEAFDAVVGDTNNCPDAIRNGLIDFPLQTAVIAVPKGGDSARIRAEALAGLLPCKIESANRIRLSITGQRPPLFGRVHDFMSEPRFTI